MSALAKLHHWHRTRAGLLAFALVEIVLAYACASWAINSGRLLAYGLGLLLLGGSLRNVIVLMGMLVRGQKRPAKRT